MPESASRIPVVTEDNRQLQYKAPVASPLSTSERDFGSDSTPNPGNNGFLGQNGFELMHREDKSMLSGKLAVERQIKRPSDIELEDLYRNYGRRYIGMACLLIRSDGQIPETAEDLFQDAVVSMFHARDIDPSNQASYLRMAVINKARDFNRNHARHRVIVENKIAHNQIEQHVPPVDEQAISNVEPTPVLLAVKDLAPRQREAIVLRYYLELNEKEIAHAMGVSRGAVKKHTSRAIGNLRHVLSDQFGISNRHF